MFIYYTNRIQRRVPMSQLSQLYQAVGNKVFSQKVCEIAPYFSTIEPEFQVLEKGYAEVTMPNTKKVHNHLGTIHAIAMCNLAEIAAGIMTDVSIPDTHRWIPVGMEVKYLARATTELLGTADGRKIDWENPGDKIVVVTITDTNNIEVCQAQISMKVGLKKQEP
jgi:acyl-coenzyme A thioesterase PaaI-like protein